MINNYLIFLVSNAYLSETFPRYLKCVACLQWIKEVRRVAKLQPSEAEQLFYEMDVNGDGRLRFDEFQAFMSEVHSPPKILDRDSELQVVRKA